MGCAGCCRRSFACTSNAGTEGEYALFIAGTMRRDGVAGSVAARPVIAEAASPAESNLAANEVWKMRMSVESLMTRCCMNVEVRESIQLSLVAPAACKTSVTVLGLMHALSRQPGCLQAE